MERFWVGAGVVRLPASPQSLFQVQWLLRFVSLLFPCLLLSHLPWLHQTWTSQISLLFLDDTWIWRMYSTKTELLLCPPHVIQLLCWSAPWVIFFQRSSLLAVCSREGTYADIHQLISGSMDLWKLRQVFSLWTRKIRLSAPAPPFEAWTTSPFKTGSPFLLYHQHLNCYKMLSI